MQHFLHALHIETGGVMAVILLYLLNLMRTLSKELVIVQVSVITWNTVIVTHINSLSHLLTSDKSLINFSQSVEGDLR